ncbi:arginine--tRNA ligase, partial [Candidatus Poribacteria bacterium]|nr:arginine--tRNA ligase [Candidatus Poribacteria bacterium]
MEERIRKAIKKALAQAAAPETAFAVERSSVAAHGDYATNAALAAAKALGRNPRELADELARSIKNTFGEVERAEVAGPGFINITLSKEAVTFAVAEAVAQG